MRSGSFYDILSDLNDSMYQGNTDYKNWKVIDTYTDNSGVHINLYKDGEDVLFAIKGTEVELNRKGYDDIKADLSLAVPKVIPHQFKAACSYFESIKEIYPNIVFTGYSLGGSIAQLLGSKYGNETITFCAYGTGQMLKSDGSNIRNYGNAADPIFLANFDNQIGSVYIMPVHFEKTLNPLYYHMMFQHGKPSEANKFTGNFVELVKKYDVPFIDKVAQYLRKGMLGQN